LKYTPSDRVKKQVEDSFTYQAPKEDQIPRYNTIRCQFKNLALTVIENCPESRELSAALTLLQNANMMANASIAVNEKEE